MFLFFLFIVVKIIDHSCYHSSPSTPPCLHSFLHFSYTLHYFALFTPVEAADISIKPEETTLPVTEGSNTTLSCTYTGSVNSLHWYQQKPGSRPEFLLLIHEASEHVTEAQPPHPRLSIKLDKISKKVELIISSAAVSDSALYYCAQQPTLTGNPAALYKNFDTVLNVLHH
ncbi:hypothetical protein C0J45_5551 [Silurus meridionalis]|nr:hypothetical protein C0J45_5551 [Silurus meridionalis]